MEYLNPKLFLQNLTDAVTIFGTLITIGIGIFYIQEKQKEEKSNKSH